MSRSREILIELTQEQFLFLEDFGKRCGSSAANQGISKASILRCLLKLFEEVDVDMQGVMTENDLLQRSLNALKYANFQYLS
jgi:hypothetical protein